MGAAIDLTNQVFGRLTAIEKTEKRANKSIVWRCRCECGNECEVAAISLRKGRTKSCGCLKKETDRAPKGNVKDLMGQKFGHLLVIDRDGSDARGEAKWLCQCDCKAKSFISVLGSNLRSGHTTSCGCNRVSRGEQKIIDILVDNNIPFVREYSTNDLGQFRFDFYLINEGYCIEYDGETHFKCNLHGWHDEEHFLKQQERDAIKNQWCRDNGVPLIRIPYTHYDKLNIEDLKLETTTFRAV